MNVRSALKSLSGVTYDLHRSSYASAKGSFACIYKRECVCLSESVGLRCRLMRKIEALKAEESGSGPPDEFLCPIAREMMKDPVIAAGGTMK